MVDELDRAIAKEQARRGLSGVSATALVCEAADLAWWAGEQGYEGLYANERLRAIEGELDKRLRWIEGNTKLPERFCIEAIKERVTGDVLADIVGQYTQVWVDKAVWQYQCRLHGADRHPSGVIYRKDTPPRWQCFTCNKGGDAIDFLVAYGNMTTRQALEQLSNHLGIPLPKENKPGEERKTAKRHLIKQPLI